MPIVLLYLAGLYLMHALYFTYLIHILDFIAHIGAIVFLKVAPFRVQIIDANLKLVFPENTPERNAEIKFLSTKLSILTLFVGLHQRFLIDNRAWMDNYTPYDRDDLFAEIRADYAYKKAIFITPHYGFFYDMTSLYNLWRMNAVVFYDIPSKMVERFIFGCRRFVGILTGRNKDLFKKYMKDLYTGKESPETAFINAQPALVMVCDQKSVKQNATRFLGQVVPFHTTPVDVHKRTKRAIWVWFFTYDFRNKRIIHEAYPIQRECDGTDPQVIVQRIADAFSEKIQANPEQYFWLHNRFNLIQK